MRVRHTYVTLTSHTQATGPRGQARGRRGGRAALVSLLGLDMVADLGLEQQIDTAVEFANAFGPLAIVGFLGAWCVAKVWSLL